MATLDCIDLSDPEQYHYNYNTDGAMLHYNYDLNQPIPPGTPYVGVKYCRFYVKRPLRRLAYVFIQNNYVEDGDSVLLVGDGFGWMNEAFREFLPNSQIVSTDVSPWIHAVKNQSDADTIRGWCTNNTRYRSAPIEDSPLRPMVLTPAQIDEWTDIISTGPWSTVEIHDEDMLSAASARRVKAKVSGGRYRFAFSGDVFPWVDDHTARSIANHMRTVATNIAHYATPYEPKAYSLGLTRGEMDDWNWKYVRTPRADVPANVPIHARLRGRPWYTTDTWKSLLPNDRFETGTLYRGTGHDIED